MHSQTHERRQGGVPNLLGAAPLYVSRIEKVASALAAFGVVLLIAIALFFGLQIVRIAQGPVALFSILRSSAHRKVEPPVPPVGRARGHVRRARAQAAKGAPSPPNLKNKATPTLALPILQLKLPPVVVATQPAAGSAASTGAADQPDSGRGAGGVGEGTGGGGDGGNGDGGGDLTAPRHIHGHLSFSDLPEGVLEPGRTARVGVRYKVNFDGHVSDCTVDESSGISELDTLTCRLIEQRFRFRPSHDGRGQPVRSIIVENHTWVAQAKEELGEQ